MTSTTPQPAAPNFHYRVDTYEDNQQRRMFERVVVFGQAPPEFARFIGQAQLNLPHPMAPGGVLHHPFTFRIEADSVERAFALFEVQAKAQGKMESERIHSEIRRQMTAIQPASADALRVLDASGNPISKPPR